MTSHVQNLSAALPECVTDLLRLPLEKPQVSALTALTKADAWNLIAIGELATVKVGKFDKVTLGGLLSFVARRRAAGEEVGTPLLSILERALKPSDN